MAGQSTKQSAKTTSQVANESVSQSFWQKLDFWQVTQILATIGIGLAIYLFYSYLAPVPPTLCEINATVNCDAVTKGPLAEWFGVPVSLVGLIGYITILYAAVRKNLKLMLAMVTFGMLFCLRLTFLEIFVEHVICPVCILCQTIMATLFGMVLYKYFRRDTPSTPPSLKQ